MSDPSISSYRDLRVWQDAMILAESCYRLTGRFPRDELFGLTSQVRRAAASIPANIAEGHGRESTGSFVQSLRVSQGSLKELETHLLLAERVGVLPASELELVMGRCESLGKMVRALIRALQDKSAK
ncbi:four helix bundle protein [Bradyrhizobium sp. Leo170]|uniref:four helix bundle protein n=1 Tax=Bradyrhizobium sp. Leo170 TaxID=1571199 RepID=UPI00102E25D6|nr:four helix bundle protein [Bradyrhizobium sp. Leo170]TAI67565.1 diversity-generating retroelement protein bAvd family protein [Bradyrhizobium sp. Leo170]